MIRNPMKRERSYSGSDDYNSDYDRRNGESSAVYVSNIAFDGTIKELKSHFSNAGEVMYVHMLKDETNRFKGCCVITFKDSNMADKAIKTLNRSDFKGRKLVVKEESANPELRQRGKKSRLEEPPSLNISSANEMNTYGLSMQFLKSLKIDLPLVSTVFVANFGYDVTDENLKEVFSLAGNINDYEVFKDKEGSSRGFGIVEYEHPVEAVQAISMLHNQTYKDRLLVVRMDRSEKKRESKLRLPAGLKSVGMGLGPDGSPLKDVRSLPAVASVNQVTNVAPLGSMGTNVGLMSPQLPPTMNTGLIDGMMSRPNSFGSSLGLSSRPYDNGSQYMSRGSLGLGNVITISNLPMDFNSDDLHKLCWTYGDVLMAEMRSKGTGVAKYNTETEARRAADQLDRQNCKGSILVASVL